MGGDVGAALAAIAQSKDAPSDVVNALIDAATFGHVPLLNALLDGKASVRPASEDLSGAVLGATEAGQLNSIQALANARADLSGGASTHSRRSFLWQAAWNGYADLAAYLSEVA